MDEFEWARLNGRDQKMRSKLKAGINDGFKMMSSNGFEWMWLNDEVELKAGINGSFENLY